MTSRHVPGGTIWFCIRRNGAARHEGWIDVDSLSDLRRVVGAHPDEVVEACIAENFCGVAHKRFADAFFPRARGIVGMEISFRGEIVRLAPTRMIAANLSFNRALERFLVERNIQPNDFAAEGHLQSFTAMQYLLPGDKNQPVELFRGATLIDPDTSSVEDHAAELGDGIKQWMLSNLLPDGGLPYKYWPSRGEESPADNAIRRFLASLRCTSSGNFLTVNIAIINISYCTRCIIFVSASNAMLCGLLGLTGQCTHIIVLVLDSRYR